MKYILILIALLSFSLYGKPVSFVPEIIESKTTADWSRSVPITSNTWYPLAYPTLAIRVPAGTWWIEYQAILVGNSGDNTSTNIEATVVANPVIATSGVAEYNMDFNALCITKTGASAGMSCNVSRKVKLTLTSATIFTIAVGTQETGTGAGIIRLSGVNGTAIIRAIRIR